MTKAFPTSLRWRVIMIRQRGLSLKQIAERLLVSPPETFVKKVILLYEATGSVNDPPRSKSKKRKISAAEILLIRRAIEDNPELYLDELQAWIEYQTGEVYSIQTLSRWLYHVRCLQFIDANYWLVNEMNGGAASSDDLFLSSNQSSFLFMDESSKDERTIQSRKHIVSKKGNFTRGTRYSVLAALSTQGIQAAHSVVGAFDRSNFEFTMEMFVLPHVGSVAMGEPCSIVVFDNSQNSLLTGCL
ncbi:hypothetical protein QZH41_012658 [Actinostola sp. cb2023]|nr:hypothetical protein QZH41_012658 [Actinostola sp. cb2023]